MKVMKLATMVVLLAIGVTQTYADQTNLVQNINFRLFGLRQGGTTTNRSLIITSVDTVRLNTRQVIEALAAATANSFSSTSRLVLVTPVDGGVPAVQVRDGDNKVNVSGFFVINQIGSSVSSSMLNTRNGASVQNTYSIQRFVLQDAGDSTLTTHFDVNGLAVETETNNVWQRRPGNGFDVDVTGTGDRNGDALIIQGSINLFGNTLEVVSSGGGGML